MPVENGLLGGLVRLARLVGPQLDLAVQREAVQQQVDAAVPVGEADADLGPRRLLVFATVSNLKDLVRWGVLGSCHFGLLSLRFLSIRPLVMDKTGKKSGASA